MSYITYVNISNDPIHVDCSKSKRSSTWFQGQCFLVLAALKKIQTISHRYCDDVFMISLPLKCC